jgi:hypothetical protein
VSQAAIQISFSSAQISPMALIRFSAAVLRFYHRVSFQARVAPVPEFQIS